MIESEMIIPIGVLITLVLVLGFLFSYKTQQVHELKQGAIALGYASYNSTNGEWQWKTNLSLEYKP